MVTAKDAAVALAEYIAGSEEEFVNMMNKKANSLGLTDTNFKNCHGLDEANHYSSAYDMAIMAKELVKHEKIFEFTSIYEDYLRKGTDRSFWLVNTNKLIKFYPGVDGLKTGYTSSAGFCITATALKNDMRTIAVVMGEPDTKTRNSEVSSIFDYVYASYAINKIVDKDEVLENAYVEKGKKETVGIISVMDVSDLYKKLDDKVDITYEIKLDKIKAPVKKGDVVGTLILSDGRNIDLTVNEDILKANIFEMFYRNLVKVIN